MFVQATCLHRISHSVKSGTSMLIKIQPDETVCRYLFTAKSLYMFRVSQHPSSGVLKTVTAASDTGHTVKYKDWLEWTKSCVLAC